MQDIDRAEGIVSLEFLGVQPGFPNPHAVRGGRRSVQGPLPSHARKEFRCFHRSLDHSFPVSERFIADHAVRSLAAAPGADTFPVYAAMNPDALSRTGTIRRGLDRPQRMIGAAVVFVGSFGMRGVDMVFLGVCLFFLPEGKPLSAGQTILQIALHTPRHAAHRLIGFLRPVAALKEQRAAALAAEAGQPALLILKSPEGHARHVGGSFPLGFQQNGEEIAVPLGQTAHGGFGGIRGKDVQLGDLNLKAQCAIAPHRFPILLQRRRFQLHMRLHSHAVDQALRQQRGKDDFTDGFPLFGKEGIVVVVEQAHARSFPARGHAKGLQNEILSHRLRPEGGAKGPAVNRFIDNIPGINHAGIFCLRKGHHTLDIGIQTGQHRLPIRQRSILLRPVILGKKPPRRLVMPHQRVTAHADPVLLRKVKIFPHAVKAHRRAAIVRGGISLILLPVKQRFRFHVVLAGHGSVLGCDRPQSGGMIKRVGRYGRADREIRPVYFIESHFHIHSCFKMTRPAPLEGRSFRRGAG